MRSGLATPHLRALERKRVRRASQCQSQRTLVATRVPARRHCRQAVHRYCKLCAHHADDRWYVRGSRQRRLLRVATLAGALGPTDTRVQLGDMRDLDLAVIGTESLIDEEQVRIDAIDAVAGTLTIAHGCVGTVPAAHAEGARVWCTDTYVGADPTEYLAAETVDAKLLTRAQQGTLDAALALVAQVRLNACHARPYPPGRLRINDSAWPQTSFA
jgi:hypothetical protein